MVIAEPLFVKVNDWELENNGLLFSQCQLLLSRRGRPSL